MPRSFSVWFSFKALGPDMFRENVEKYIALAEYFTYQLKAIPSVEVIPPQLSIVCFRLLSGENRDSNELTMNLFERITADGQIYLSATTIDNLYWIRLCVCTFNSSLHGANMTINVIKQKVKVI